MHTDRFASRHIGPRLQEIPQMFEKIGVSSLDELIDQTVPSSIRLRKPLALPNGLTERQYYRGILDIASKNKVFNTYIGMGYYDTITPAVILRNVLENPVWYTSYTPYQAEISQGRLEALLNFQTMIVSLTAMGLANASLLDEATAAAEAMMMMLSSRSKEKKKADARKFFVDEKIWPQTYDVIATRAEPLGIELVTGEFQIAELDETFFGALVQYPDADGSVHDYSLFVQLCHEKEIQVAVAADLLSLALLTPPGEWGADIVVGSSQRFGVPMGYGGPHAAFFAAREHYKRNFPDELSGFPAIQRVKKRFEWLCKPANNTSSVSGQLPIFVPHRLYWQRWPVFTASIMARKESKIFLSAFTVLPIGLLWKWKSWGTARLMVIFLTRLNLKFPMKSGFRISDDIPWRRK